MSVTIRCWPALTSQRIPASLHGLSIAHAGQCIYDGIRVEEDAAIPNRKGIRLDVLAALTHLRIPVISWPGRSFSREYHWKHGVCRKEQRRLTTNASAQQLEPNTFGTEDFLYFCRELGTVPCLQVNTHTGRPQEARDWVEYCNFPGCSTLAELRSQAGSAKPHNVPFWDLAAAPFNSSPYFATHYAERYCSFAAAMKAIAPDIHLWAGPGTPLQELPKNWFADFVQSIVPTLLPQAFTTPCRLSVPAPEDCNQNSSCQSYVQIHELEDKIKALHGLLRYYQPEHDFSLTVNDWRLSEDNLIQELTEPRRTIQAALLGASFLHSMHRLAPLVSSALFGPAINVGQCLAVTQGERIYLTPLYHIFDIMRPHREGRLVAVKSSGTELPAESLQPSRPLLDICASLTKKKLYLTVINASQTETLEGYVDIRDATISSASGRMVKGSKLTDENNWENPSLINAKRLRPLLDNEKLPCSFPPLSVTAFSLSLSAR